MPRPKGSKNQKPAGVRVNAIVSQKVAEWLKSNGISQSINQLVEEKMYEKHNNAYARLEELDFTRAEIAVILEWWDVSEHYDWLMSASRAEIEAATAPAYEIEE